MRRTEYLITEIRNSTDNADENGVKDAEIISYLNYGQRLIQNIIFAVNPKADVFRARRTYEYSESGYDLPNDIFAENSLFGVCYVQGGERCQLDRIDPFEQACGYYTEDEKLYVKGYDNLPIEIFYFAELPRMDKRWGEVDIVNSGISLELKAGFDENIGTVDDRISLVDKFGAQVLSDIFIDNFNAGTLETTNALTGAASGQYVCLGANSVNASKLPSACETYLLDYVRQRIYSRNNYEDAGKQSYFTESQKSDLSSLFSNNQRDNLVPPVTDYESMDF